MALSFTEEFEILKEAAASLELLQTPVALRRTDGQPSMKTRVKYEGGERKEVKEDKPMKSVHHFIFPLNLELRIKRSKRERKEHLKLFLEIVENKNLTLIKELLSTMTGLAKGKNIIWQVNASSHTYKDFDDYHRKMKEEFEDATAIRPAVGDDLVLLEGW